MKKNKINFPSNGKFTVSLIATSILLSACGGGFAGLGGGGSSFWVVPIKGQFGAGCVVNVTNPAGSFSVNGTTGANGQASVTLPAGATGPYVVSVQGGGTCTYFNDNAAAPAMLPFTAGSILKALVPTNDATAGATVAITPITQMAYAYAAALPGGIAVATDSSASTASLSALNLAVTQGLLPSSAAIPGGNIFAPPASMPASGVSNATYAASPYLAMFATISAQSSVNPMAAVDAYSSLANVTGLSVASATSPAAAAMVASAVANATAFFASISSVNAATSAVFGAASGNAITPPPSIASAVQQTATNSAALTNFQTDVTVGGIGNFNPGWVQNGVTNNGFIHVTTATLVNGVYSLVNTVKQLLNNAWVAFTRPAYYVWLTNAWVNADTQPGTATADPINGTISINQGYQFTSPLTMLDLSGTSTVMPAVGASGVMALNASGIPTMVTVTYPAGSREYLMMMATTPVNEWAVAADGWNTLTDASGVALTTLAQVGQLTAAAPGCFGGGWYSIAASGATTNGAGTYVASFGCGASGVPAAGTFNLVAMANPALLMASNVVANASGVMMMPVVAGRDFFAVTPDNKVHGGTFTPAGGMSPQGGMPVNKAARDAQLTATVPVAAGLPGI